MLLAVQYRGSQVEIHCDQAGLDRLIKRLQALQQAGAPGSEHLMTQAWGGKGLSVEEPGEGREWVNHLKITLVSAS